MPRVPAPPNINLNALVTGLSNAAPLVLRVNSQQATLITRNGAYHLLTGNPGLGYNVSITGQPPGHACTMTHASGNLSAATTPVLVSCALSISLGNDLDASESLGQRTGGSATAAVPPTASSLNGPHGKTYTGEDGTLYVADTGNNRVLGYYPPAQYTGESATVVLGQSNNFATSASGLAADLLSSPAGVGGESGRLVVADRGNHRVLIFNSLPQGHVAADVVVGQPDFVTASPTCSPNGLNAPDSATVAAGMLIVADTGNHRVLIWNSVPTAHATPADEVLGQAGMNTCSANAGGAASASTLLSPQDAWSDGSRLFVADTGNARVLAWRYMPIIAGEFADFVLGQASMTVTAALPTGGSSFASPTSVASDSNVLYVSDAAAARVLAFYPVPRLGNTPATYTLGQASFTGAACNQGAGSPRIDTLCNPSGVSFSAGALVVTDTGNNRIQIYHSDPNAATRAVGYLVIVTTPASVPTAPVGTATAGRPAHVTITAYNVNGTPDTAYRGSISLSTTDANALLNANYTFSPNDNGQASLTGTFYTAGAQVVTAVDANRARIQGNENIVVSPGDANHMTVSGFPPVIGVGVQGNVTVTLYDDWNNIATGYTGTVRFTSNDAAATLPANLTFGAGAAGVAVAQVTFGQAGISRITVTDTHNSALTASQQNIVVNSNTGNAVTFSFSGYTTPVAAGAPDSFTVTARDANGQVAIGYVGTAHFTGSDTAATYPADTAFDQNAQGVAVVTTTFGTSGNQTITATDTVNSSITGASPPVVVQGGNAVALRVFGYPTPVTAGQNANVTLQAVDAYGNPATTFADLVNIRVQDAAAAVSPNHTFVLSEHGTALIPVVFKTSGTWTIDAADANVLMLAGEQNGIVVNPGPAVRLTVLGYPGMVTAGATWPVAITARDAYDNLATSYNGTAYVATTDPNAITPPLVSFTGGVPSATVPITMMQTGTYAITANDIVTTGLAGMQNGIVVTPAAMAAYGLSLFPSPVTAGQQANVTITAYDVYSNVVSNYTGTAHFTSTDPNAVLPPDLTFVSGYAGTANVPVILKTSGLQSINANDTNRTTIAGNQNQILVNPNAAQSLRLSNMPSIIDAGQAGNLMIRAIDAYGNIATGYTGTVHLSSTDGNAALGGNITFGAGDLGAKTVSITMATVGLQTIDANDMATPTIAGNLNTTVVSNNGAAYFVVNHYPATVTAGQSANVTVTAYDAYGNLVTGYTGTVHLHGTDPNASMQTDLTFVTGYAGSANMTVTFKTAGTQSIDANDVGSPVVTGQQTGIVVSPNVTYSLSVAGFSSPILAGTPNSVTVTAYDAYGNLTPAYTGQVAVTSSDPNAVRPGNYTFTGAGGSAGVHALSVTLLTAGNQNITVTDTGGALVTGVQNNIAVSPANANHFTLAGYPTPVAAGSQGNVTVTAYDAYNNIATGYTGNLRITGTDANAAYPPDTAFRAGMAGTVSLGVTFATVGNQTLMGNDVALPLVAGAQGNIVVTAAAAKLFRVSGYPSPIVAGTSGSVHVAAYDNYNNLVTNYAGTVHLSTGDTNAVMPSDLTFGAGQSGAANFTVTFHTSGNQTINANDVATPVISGNQNGIVVSAASPNYLTARGFSNPVAAGAQGNIMVTAYDVFNNVATGYAGTVAVTSADANAIKPANYSFSGGDAGVHALAVTLRTTGNQNIVITDVGTATLTATQPNIVVKAGAAVSYGVTGYPTTVTAGQQGNVNVVAYDVYRNIATGYTGTLHVSSSDANAGLPADVAFQAANAGNVAVQVALKTVGLQSINGNDYDVPTIAGIEPNITVNPNVAYRLQLSGYPTTVITGQQGNVTVTVLDAYNNIATGYTGSVAFSSDDAAATVPANANFTLGNAGVKVVQLAFGTVGAHALVGNDTVTPAIAGSLPVTVVNPNSATHFLVKSFPTMVTAGQQGNVQVVALDAYNNIVTSYGGNVRIRSTDPNAVLPPDYAFQPGDQGNAFLPVTLVTAGTRAISANDTTTVGITGMQNGILVNPNVAVRMTVTGFPAFVSAGSPNFVAVTVFDNYNNIATGYTGVVRLSSSDPNASLSGNTTLVNGTGLLAVTLDTAGTQWVNANDMATPSLAAAQAGIVVSANTVTVLRASGYAASVSACQGSNITITAYDSFGNINPNYTGTVTLTTQDPNAALPAPAVFAAANAGVRTLPVTLKTPGTWNIVATDGGGLTATQGNIVVAAGSPNIVTLVMPATVLPTQTFGGTIVVSDNCNNVATSYTGTINLTSGDAAGTPSSTPVGVVFGGGDFGVKSVSGLKLPTVNAAQAMLGKDSASPLTINGNTTIAVAPQSFYAEWDFTTANAPSYTYNSSKIDFTSGYAELTPIYTAVGDSTSANFSAALASTNVRWDSGVNALVLGGGNVSNPALYFEAFEWIDPVMFVDTADAAAGGSSNVGGYPCCSLTAPETHNGGAQTGRFGRGLMYSGNATANPSYFNTKIVAATAQNFTINAGSYLQYWIQPSSASASTAGGPASSYVMVNLIFTDGTQTKTASLTDTTGTAFTPLGQGSAGRLTQDAWNVVQVNLSSLAGKALDRIDVAYQSTQTGKIRGFIDDILITGVQSVPPPSSAELAADWTPKYSSIIAYYPFNGTGRVANSATVTAAIGSNLTVSNADGNGMIYTQGKLNQAIYLDGYDDHLVVPTANFPNSNTVTIAAWIRAMSQGTAYQCGRLFYFGNSGGAGLSFIPFCGGSNGSYSGTMLMANGMTTQALTFYDSWVHLAATIDANNLGTIYLDGVQMSAATLGGNVASIAGTYNFIGRDTSGPGVGDYFGGFVDEFAVWNVVLNANEVRLLYERQAPAFSGTLTSRTFASPFQSAGSQTMSWGTNQPAFKGIASNAVSENANDYASISGGLASGLKAVWHLDESALGTVYGGDFYDDTGHGNTGVAWQSGGTLPTPGQPGLLNKSVYFNSTINGLIGSQPFPRPYPSTVQAWFRKTLQNSGLLVGLGDNPTGYSGNRDHMLFMDLSGLLWYYVNAGNHYVKTPTAYADGRWHHALATNADDGSFLYVDGALVASDATIVNGPAYTGYWHVGCDNIGLSGVTAGNYCFIGNIDEVAVWNRRLSAAEILQLYRRGANRLLYRVRTCNNATCSDNQAWQGPDGTYETYFSELNNVSGISQLYKRPNLGLATYSSFNINSNQPYIQYQAVLQSDDLSYQCTYNGAAGPCSPENSNILFSRTNYDTTSPSVANANTVAFKTLASFAGTSGYPGCPGGITYTLSPTGATYYWYNGSTWASSNGTVGQTNTQASITAAALTAFGTQFGIGQTYYKAYLTSAGILPCTLESVVMTGTQ